MKTKLVITLFLLLAIMMGGAFMLAQETGEGDMQPANGFVRAHLVNIIGPNRYTLIINEEEVVVALMGLDFENADFYIFDQKHYQYAEWLLMDYIDVWVDYDPNRTTAKGTPLVYFYYGPFDTEVWEDSRTDVDNDGNNGQSEDVNPSNVNYWGEDVDNYDHTINEPFLDDPEFSTVFQNWGPVYDPTSHGMEYVDADGRKWYLRDLNKLMLLSGYAEVDMDGEYDRKAEFIEAMNKAKWCRRGMWSILLPPNPENEEVCGIKSKN